MPTSPFFAWCISACRSLGLAVALAGAAPWAHAQLHTQALNTGWQFRLADAQAAAAHPEAKAWRAATVPGIVQTDLLDAKLIAEPFAADNEAQLQWIGLADWDYQLQFQADADTLASAHVDL